MKGTLKPPEIPEKDQSPLVEQLLAFIEQQSIIIQQLKDEIARLKNQPPRPTIKPSRLGKSKKHTSKSSRNKRPGSKKRSKTAQLQIHKRIPLSRTRFQLDLNSDTTRISLFKTSSSTPAIHGFVSRSMKRRMVAMLPAHCLRI
jgi:hypothetical protein